MKELTVGKLKQALKDVPDCLIVAIGSDSGVDQGGDCCIVEDAYRVNYPGVDYFTIYANYYDEEDLEDKE